MTKSFEQWWKEYIFDAKQVLDAEQMDFDKYRTSILEQLAKIAYESGKLAGFDEALDIISDTLSKRK